MIYISLSTYCLEYVRVCMRAVNWINSCVYIVNLRYVFMWMLLYRLEKTDGKCDSNTRYLFFVNRDASRYCHHHRHRLLFSRIESNGGRGYPTESTIAGPRKRRYWRSNQWRRDTHQRKENAVLKEETARRWSSWFWSWCRKGVTDLWFIYPFLCI